MQLPTTHKYTPLLVQKMLNFQYQMEQTIRINYFNPIFNIGLSNWREAWLLSGKYPEKLNTELYRNKLVYRKRGTNKRISYQQIKKGLIKKIMILSEEPLPF